jgi:elongation factor 1-beta
VCPFYLLAPHSSSLARSRAQINAVVEDEKVSTDDMQEQIEAFEDYVQSVDVVAFQKI